MKKRIRTLFVTHVTNMAGANRSMYQLILELKNEYNVLPVVLGPKCDNSNSKIKTNIESIGVEYIENDIRFFKIASPTTKSFISYLRYLYTQRFLYKKLLPYHFDIIHSNSSVIDIGAYLRLQLKCKHVWHLRDFGDKDYSLYPVGGNLYERFTYRHADAFIAISKAIQKHYNKKVDARKVNLIYNGIKDVEKDFVAKHNNNRTEFICAGIITPGKNQMEIVKAADELVNKRNVTNFHITLVGFQEKNYINTINQLITNKKINSFFTILKETDHIKDLVSKMDVGIMCSKAEAFGRVTVEYMLQNLLVIANNQGANPEILKDEETGYIYEAGSYLRLADKMQNIINASVFPTNISEAGRCFAESRFLSKHNTLNIYELYCRLLNI